MEATKTTEAQFNRFLKSAEAVKDAIPIMDLAPRYIDLQRSGGNYLGLCPFHSEKTPSFYLYADTNRYYCYGCKATGDVINLHHRCGNFGTLWEAVVSLAEEFGVTLPQHSDRWHEWQDEKGRRWHKAEEVLARAYQRRYFRLFGGYLDSIEDPDERKTEAAAFYEDLYTLARLSASYRMRSGDHE